MQGILSKTRCYLIGNLQSTSFSNARAWREKFCEDVKPMGIITMSPLDKIFKNFAQEDELFKQRMSVCLEKGDLLTVHKEMQRIRRRDLAMIDHSTFIVGVLEVEKPTFGCIEEISFATRANKPLFLVIQPNLKQIPLWLLGMMKPGVFYNSLEEVVIKLNKINSGEEFTTDDQWRIFEDKYNTIS